MQRWIPPLPQGWEGRWDPGQRRYFFINHQTKKTQWDDPRFPQPQPQVNPHAAAASLSPAAQHQHQARPGSRSPSPATQAYQMQDMRTSPRRSEGRSSQHERHAAQQESSMSEEIDQALVDKLHRDFPNTTKALIADILASCFNNEREAREQLNDLGFAKKDDRRTGPSSATISSGGASQPQQQQPKELTVLEKNRIHQQMSVAFPAVGMDVIEMSMKVVKYDVTKGKALIQRYLHGNTKTQNAASGSGSGSQRGASASSSSTRVASPARTEPAGLKISSDNQPQGLSSGAGQMPTSSVARILTGSSGNSNITQITIGSSGSTSSFGGRQQPTQYSSAKQVTKRNNNRRNVPPKRTVVTAQPQQSQRPHQVQTRAAVGGSSQGSGAMGPDPSLRKGPDVTLLSSDLSNAYGPDLTLRNGPDNHLCAGPDRGRVLGPMGAAGPDRSLRCGPQASLLGCNVDQSKLLVSEI